MIVERTADSVLVHFKAWEVVAQLDAQQLAGLALAAPGAREQAQLLQSLLIAAVGAEPGWRESVEAKL